MFILRYKALVNRTEKRSKKNYSSKSKKKKLLFLSLPLDPGYIICTVS